MNDLSKIEKDVQAFLSGDTKGKQMYFAGTTIKNPIEYKLGEPIVFKIWVECDGKRVIVPYIRFFIEGDDGEKSEGYIKSDTEGIFYIETTLKRDGFVHVIAEACDEDKVVLDGVDKFEGGAGADIEKIKCETDIPEDYFDFWKALKEEAASIPEEIVFEEQFEALDGFKAFDMRLKTTTADFISLTYTYPENATPGSLKLLIICMGYGVADATPVFREGYLTVRINTHDIFNRQPKEYYVELEKTKYFRYGLRKEENLIPQTTYWRKLFIRDIQALNFFKKNALVVGNDIEFEGGSQAAFQACNLAAHTGAAARVRLYVPWFCDLFAIEKQKRIEIKWRPIGEAGLRYFDTAIAAKFLKCPVYIEAGLGDYICPPSGQMAMYNGITAPKKLRFIQNKTHPYTPPVLSCAEISESYNECE